MDTLKGYYKKGKDLALNAPEIERKVKDATSNDKWGPTGTQMAEISRATMNFNDFPIIMGVIWKRINDPGKYWRHVYKSLLLIDYLIRNGSEQVIRDCRNHLIEVQTLTEFQYIEEEKDVGLSVRERAKQVIDLLQDDKRIKIEREKAKSNRDKYVGVGNEGGPRYGGYEGGGYSAGYGNESGYGNDRYGGGGYGNDKYGGGYGNESKYGGYGNEGRYSSDSYSSGRGNSNGPERDYGYDRDEYKAEDRYGGRQDEDNSYRHEERNEDTSEQRSAPPRTASSGSVAPRSRPRAPSGGGEPPRAVEPPLAGKTANLLSIDDVLNTPAPPPQSHTESLFEVFQQPVGLGSQPDQFGTFQSGGFRTELTGNASNVSGDFFNPRAGTEQPEWSEFHGSSTSDNFNPFGAQASHPSEHTSAYPEPIANDPWAKKDLFNLDSLNISDKDKSKVSAPGVSPSKTPMAAQSKAPMVASKPTVSSGPTIRPPTLAPTTGFGQQPIGFGQPSFGPAGYGQQPGVGYGQPPGVGFAQPTGYGQPPMGRGMPGPYGPQPVYPYGQPGFVQPGVAPPGGFNQPFQQQRNF